jgi:DoxX-like family
MTTGNPSSAFLWSGRVLTALVTLVMIADAAVDIFYPRLLQVEIMATGFPAGQLYWVGTIILVCAALYAVPRTCVFGAILMTGFLGGAICTHFRVGEIATAPQLVSLLLGASAWGALYLRDRRVRNLLPLVNDVARA